MSIKEDAEQFEAYLAQLGYVKPVRCKDCRHYTGKWCTRYSTKQCDINDICKDADDYCSDAERKEHAAD